LNQSQINSRYAKTKERILQERAACCANCGTTSFLTPSHTIAQKDCKNYNYVELIWDENNIEILCVQCHDRWERRDKGLNIYPRLMEYIKNTIPEVWSRYKMTAEWKR
jgi:5-methylcytosine-specific restriction endonuclease McrA